MHRNVRTERVIKHMWNGAAKMVQLHENIIVEIRKKTTVIEYIFNSKCQRPGWSKY